MDTMRQPNGAAAIVKPTREADDSDGSCDGDLVLDDVLVEDVSIDGMCGVY